LPARGARLAVAGVERHHPPVHAFAQRVEAQHLAAALDRSLHLVTGDEMVEQPQLAADVERPRLLAFGEDPIVEKPSRSSPR
jgi:hypothetical protein